MSVKIMGPNQVPQRSKKMDMIAIGVVCTVLVFAVVILIFAFKDYNIKRSMELVWNKMQHLADSEDPEQPDDYVDENGETVVVTEEIVMKDYLYRPINLAALREVNPDVSGYIYIPNTQVDYPILKETEPKKYFYLDHNIYKNPDKYGSIFELCDEERSLNTVNNAVNIIFGHHMASGAMFSGIYSYQEQDFMSNPVYVYRDDYRIEYRAFATCVVDKNDPIYDFDAYGKDSDNYTELLERIKTISKTECVGEWPTPDQKIVMLSTCKGAAGTSNRLLVCLVETRRAMVPEYYNSIKDVDQYGGSREEIEVTPESDGGIMNEMLDSIEDQD